MRIILIMLIGLMVSNCSNTYVKNKKNISSPNDLMKFTNIWCEKNKSTDKVIRMCGQGWSKDLTISPPKLKLTAPKKTKKGPGKFLIRFIIFEKLNFEFLIHTI